MRRNTMLGLLAGLLLPANGAATAHACDLCAIYRSMEAKSANQGFDIGVFEQFTHFGTLELSRTMMAALHDSRLLQDQGLITSRNLLD